MPFSAFSLKPVSLLALALALNISGCVSPELVGSGISQTLLRSVPSFTSVRVRHGLQLKVQENNARPSYEVRITLDDNLLGLVTTNVLNNQLEVDLLQPVSSQEKRVDILGPTLTGIALTDDSVGQVDRMGGRPQLNFDLSGKAQLQIGEVEADRADIKMVGKTKLAIGKGAVTSVVVSNAYSGAQLELENLTCQQMELTMSRGSVARVNVARKLVVALSENATVYYKGNPQIETHNLADNSRLIPLDLTQP